MQEKTIVQKVSTGIALVLALIAVCYVLMLIIELAFGYVLFSSTYNAIVNTGGFDNLYLAKAVAIACTAIWYVTMPIFIAAFIRFQNAKAAIVLGGLYLGWYLLLFALTYGSGNLVFNPLVGGANYSYYESPAGSIELYPIEYTVHPILGAPLKPVTPEIMQKYVKQHPEINNKSLAHTLNKPAPKPVKRGYWIGNIDLHNFSVQVKSMQPTTEGNLQISWRVSSLNPSIGPWVMHKEYFIDSYLVDAAGQRYRPVAVSGDFDSDGSRNLAKSEEMVVTTNFACPMDTNRKDFFFKTGQGSSLFWIEQKENK